MTDRLILEPSPEHPITVEPSDRHVTVRVHGQRVADTRTALCLQEAGYPDAYYIPLTDVAQHMLTRTDTTTYCPFKGEAGYYRVTTTGGETVEDALWTYQQPYPAVAAIAGHVAFYPDKAEISVGDG